MPTLKSTKYWPDPVCAPETNGDFKVFSGFKDEKRRERRDVSDGRDWDGGMSGVLWSNGSLR